MAIATQYDRVVFKTIGGEKKASCSCCGEGSPPLISFIAKEESCTPCSIGEIDPELNSCTRFLKRVTTDFEYIAPISCTKDCNGTIPEGCPSPPTGSYWDGYPTSLINGWSYDSSSEITTKTTVIYDPLTCEKTTDAVCSGFSKLIWSNIQLCSDDENGDPIILNNVECDITITECDYNVGGGRCILYSGSAGDYIESTSEYSNALASDFKCTPQLVGFPDYLNIASTGYCDLDEGEVPPTPPTLQANQYRGITSGTDVALSAYDLGINMAQSKRYLNAKIVHPPSSTCYIKVVLAKHTTNYIQIDSLADPCQKEWSEDGVSTETIVYEWNGTGSPCYNDPTKPANSCSNWIDGMEISLTPTNGQSITLEVVEVTY